MHKQRMLEKHKVKPRAAEKTPTAGHHPTFLRLQPYVRRENDEDDATGQSGGVGHEVRAAIHCSQPGPALGQALPIRPGEGHVCVAAGPVDGVATGNLIRIDALSLQRHLVLLVVACAEGF